ncbi:MAG: hypothetical protein IT424_02965 [Pirellulales bacterium]|nr:hypothetical protein [Pirellulales bacterium]
MFSRPTSSTATATRGLLNQKAAARDDESSLSATLEHTRGETGVRAFRERSPASRRQLPQVVELQARLTAEEMVAAIEDRLPTRIRELAVEVRDGVFALRGVSSSYYAKQLAGHLAMRAMESRLLGRLVNEIDVRE